MFFVDLLFVIVIVLLLTGVFGAGFGRRRRDSGLWVFFIILLLATWAGGLWFAPVGPLLWGANWIGFLFAGLAFALLLAAILPPASTPGTKKESIESAKVQENQALTLNIFFWVMILGFAVAIIAAYII